MGAGGALGRDHLLAHESKRGSPLAEGLLVCPGAEDLSHRLDEQVHDNLKSLDYVARLTPEVMARIDTVLGNKPQTPRI